MGRAPCCDKAIVKRGPWSPEEDIALKSYVEKHGTGGNWIALPQKAGLRRCGKSCRLRWLNYLRPGIKHGGFTEEEDNIICSLYKNIGSRWSVIASHLPGRTDNDVKNYWNTKLKKKLLTAQANINQPSSNSSVAGCINNKHAHDSSTSSSPLAGVSVPVDKSDKQSFGSFSVSIDCSCSPSTLTSMDGAFAFNPHFGRQVAEPAPAFPAAVNTQVPNNGGSSKGYVVSPPEDVSAASSSLTTDHNSHGFVPWADNCSGAGVDGFLLELGFGQMDFLGVGGYGLFDKMGEVIGSFPAVSMAGVWPSADC